MNLTLTGGRVREQMSGPGPSRGLSGGCLAARGMAAGRRASAEFD